MAPLGTVGGTIEVYDETQDLVLGFANQKSLDWWAVSGETQAATVRLPTSRERRIAQEYLYRPGSFR